MSDEKDEIISVNDPNIPPETLRAWAKDDNEELREAVAQNPNTSCRKSEYAARNS